MPTQQPKRDGKRCRRPRHDPVFRIASQLHKRFEGMSVRTDATFNNGVLNLLATQNALGHLLRKIVLAKRHGFYLAAERLKEDVPPDIRQVASSAQDFLKVCSSPEQPVISLQHINDEIRQLQSEFEEVDLSQRGQIVVTSEPVELEGIALGRFAIELHFERLSNQPGSSCFSCVALDPNPASGNEDVTHPHVQSNGLCAGDASVPIANALKQGRICDAFCLVHSVLQTYNPNSPYISLDGWNGISCGDCGHSTDRDNLFRCDGCEGEFCDECLSSCDVCGTSRCQGCLETDSISDQRCCSRCQRTCTQCKRIVDKENFDADTRFCPECLEDHRTAEIVEDESLDPTSDTNNPNNKEIHEQPTLFPIPPFSPAQDSPITALTDGEVPASSAA